MFYTYTYTSLPICLTLFLNKLYTFTRCVQNIAKLIYIYMHNTGPYLMRQVFRAISNDIISSHHSHQFIHTYASLCVG